MQQKEVLMVVGLILVGFFLFQSVATVHQTKTHPITGYAASTKCACPYSYSPDAIRGNSLSSRIRLNQWIPGYGYPDVDQTKIPPEYNLVASATGCLPRFPGANDPCPYYTCLVVFTDGHNFIPKEYRCGESSEE